MLIRHATAGNLDEIYPLWKALETFYDNDPSNKACHKWRKNTLSLIKNLKSGGLYIALKKKKIIGYLSYQFVKRKNGPLEHCVFLSELYVIPSARNLGVATKLINRLFQEKLPSFIAKYAVTTHPKAANVIKLYTRMGFNKVGKTKAGNVLLEKRLTPH